MVLRVAGFSGFHRPFCVFWWVCLWVVVFRWNEIRNGPGNAPSRQLRAPTANRDTWVLAFRAGHGLHSNSPSSNVESRKSNQPVAPDTAGCSRLHSRLHFACENGAPRRASVGTVAGKLWRSILLGFRKSLRGQPASGGQPETREASEPMRPETQGGQRPRDLWIYGRFVF